MKASWERAFFALVDQQLAKRNHMVHDQHEIDRMTGEGCPHDPLEVPGDIPLCSSTPQETHCVGQ